MYLVYKPAGADEPRRWRYDPNKLLTVEREEIERRTGRDFADFTTGVMKGNSVCRRALLYVFLRRDHAGIKHGDVEFAWDELTLEFGRSEYERMRAEIAERMSAAEAAPVLAKLDEEMADAYDDTGEPEGKAAAPPKPAADGA